MKIGNRSIGFGEPTLVIAECCSNVIPYLRLDGDLDRLLALVASTGATAAKVQLFTHKHFPQPEWESKRAVEFPRHRVDEFVKLSHKHGLLAGASVFDNDAVTILEQAGADYIKMAVREFENLNLWQRVLESPLPKIASFDISDGEDFDADAVWPYAENTIHLACVPKYPVIDPKVPSGDLKMQSWGWSSHTPDWLDCLIAVSRGACVVEKHIKFSEHDYEAGWSLSVKEFGEMVKDIRRVERMR